MHRKLVVLLAAVALMVGACGGGDGDTKTAASKKTTTTSRSAPTTGAASGLDAATATTGNGAPATTAKPGTSATTAKAVGLVPSATPNAAPAPAKTGTYDYAQSGSTSQDGPIPPQGTLVVSGGASQLFQRDFDPSDGRSDFDVSYSFRDDGPFITKVTVKEEGLVITCTFDSPIPAPPWPPTTGRTFSGHATCTNGMRADFSGSITGRTTDSVGGTAVEAIVVDSTLHVFGNGADVTVKDTQHWAPSLRVPTYSREVVNGTGPLGIVVTGDVTSRLKSVNPR